MSELKNEILLADDEATFRETFAKVLEEEGFSVTAVGNGNAALDAITRKQYAMAILDIQMPGIDGIKVLREALAIRPQTRVIMVTAYGSVEMAVEAVKLGACDYVMKPVIFDDMLARIRQHLRYVELEAENRELREELNGRFDMSQIIGRTAIMDQVFDTIRKVAPTRSNVLITGESGTGKELVAHAIHSLSSTNAGRFVAVNCSAIPETLLESELFGHKKGSFTSACEDKKGLFEMAHGGTLFLDEVGDMSPALQVKVLRVLQEGVFVPVGGTQPVEVDVRVISATNQPLEELVEQGRFRQDLYYRLHVFMIELPPLRDRREDIPLLADHFLRICCAENGLALKRFAPAVMDAFTSYDWPGNVRELENEIERAVIMARDDDEIGPEHISRRIRETATVPLSTRGRRLDGKLSDALQDLERAMLAEGLRRNNWNKSHTAKDLGISRANLVAKVKKYGLEPPPDLVRRRGAHS